MSEFFSKVPSEETLIELLNKKDFKSILAFAKPLNPKTSVSRALSFLQTTDQHDNEFRLYMAYIIAKLNIEDLIETLDEYLTDVTTVSERRDLFFWKAKKLGVISDLFEKELAKYQALLKFMYEVTKENRVKYFNLKLTRESKVLGNSSIPTVLDKTLALLKQDAKQNTFFSKRILSISPITHEAFKFTQNLAEQLGAYHIEMKLEFVKLLGSPVIAFQLCCELAKKYRPLIVVYQDFTRIDHQILDALFLQQTPKEFLDQKTAQNTYLIAQSQTPVEIYRETFEERWFQKAIFLPPSTPDIRQDYFKKNPLSKNFQIDFLTAKSSFYHTEEIDHLINQLYNPQVGDIVKVLEQSQPRYKEWLLESAFLKTWTYYPIWEEITNYNALETAFQEKIKEQLKGEFIEDRLALNDLKVNPQALQPGNPDLLLRFSTCRKEQRIPMDILNELLVLSDNPSVDKAARKKIFRFIVFTQKPQPESLDLSNNGKIFQFALKDSSFAVDLLSTGHALSNEQLLQLAETFAMDDVDRKIMYYIERFKADDFELISYLALLFKNFNSQFIAIQALRKTIDRKNNPLALEKLFSMLLIDFNTKPEGYKFWTAVVREFNSANSERNFDQILALNKVSEKLYHLNLKSLFQLMTRVMGDSELLQEPDSIRWVLAMVSSPSSDFEEIDDTFKAQAALFIKNKKIPLDDRVRFLKALLDWKTGEKSNFEAWIQEITLDIPFSNIGWADLKNHPRIAK